MTIKQLPEVVNGRVKASVEKVDASLIDLAPTGNAIVATTEGLKVDLSGYATSVDLTNAIAAAQLEGKEVDLSGLATKTELNDAITEITTGMPLLVDTKVNTAIASVVDSAPATFDTLKEIATWIETEGVDTAGLAASIAGKVDKTEFASAIAGIGNATSQPGWTLTNATIVNGVLTYTGGTYEEEGVSGETKIGLFAQRKLKIGESVTVDFKVNTSQVSSITLSVDHGLGSKTGQWGDMGATIYQNGSKSFLYEGRGLPVENNLNEGATYKAKITRVENDKVVLEFLDSDETIIATREVFIEGLSLGRIWFTVKMVDPAVSYSTNIFLTSPPYATEIELDLKADKAELALKVDKEAGKGLSTNDFTDELKEKLIYSKTSYVDRHHDSISVVHVEEKEDSVNFLIETPGVERQMQINPKEFMSRSTVNSVPLYSLDNDGKFVLTEPDSWVSFGESNFVFPVYHLSTVDNKYLKGIVTLSAELGQDEENNPTIDFKYTHNVKDVIDGYVLYVNVMALTLDENVFPHTFTSSVEGETVFGTIKVPLTYSASGVSFQQAIDLQETRGFILNFGLTLKSGGKGTVQVSAFGTTPEEIA